MPKVMVIQTPEMIAHIEAFRAHFGIKTTMEATRQLILDGFKYNGSPLNEIAFRPRGRGASAVTGGVEALETFVQTKYKFEDD